MGVWMSLHTSTKNLKYAGLATSDNGPNTEFVQAGAMPSVSWEFYSDTRLEQAPVTALNKSTKEWCGKASAD